MEVADGNHEADGNESRRVCLDSWAVLRWLEGTQPVADLVDAVLNPTPGAPTPGAPTARPVMSWMNLGEVVYITTRSDGAGFAGAVADDLRRLVQLDELRPARVLGAAAIKAEYPMAFADAFAVATALAHDAVLWTGDPEILDQPGEWRTLDLSGI